jgi:hypothetical protein
MSTRTTSRKVAPEPPTESQMRTALAEYIAAHIAETGIVNQANEKIEAIKKDADDRARVHTAIKEQSVTTLMRYAEAHPELFTTLRKIEVFGGHKIGWQTSPPAVALVKPPGEKKKQTWQGFVDACKRIGSHWLEMVRTVEVPNKEAVLEYHRAARENAVEENDAGIIATADAQLARLGVSVIQEENFVIDLNLDEPTEPTAQAAA